VLVYLMPAFLKRSGRAILYAQSETLPTLLGSRLHVSGCLPLQAEIISMKQRFGQNMAGLMSVAHQSPFFSVSAEIAIGHYTKTCGPDGKLHEATFETATSLLASTHRITVEGEYIRKMFRTLDCDGNGALSRAEWTSGITVFFGGSGMDTDCAVIAAVFKQLDANSDGTLDPVEFQQYCLPVISRLVPKWRCDLRLSLQKRLASMVFEQIDANQKGRLTPEEFVAWCKKQSLCQLAIQCLNKVALTDDFQEKENIIQL